MKKNEVRAYQEFEFCKAVNCNRLLKSDTHADRFQCIVGSNNLCIKTMKQFLWWVDDNGFMIVKPVDNEEVK